MIQRKEMGKVAKLRLSGRRKTTEERKQKMPAKRGPEKLNGSGQRVTRGRFASGPSDDAVGRLGAMASDLDATVSGLLRGVDQRYTSGRRGLVNLLATAGRPLSIPEILTQDTTVPQSSVYRNLAVLEQAGVVHKVMATDEFSRFELTEELTRHHHHLVCVSCGTIDDYTVSPGLERTMATTIDEVSAQTGFRIQAHRIDLLGHCARCG